MPGRNRHQRPWRLARLVGCGLLVAGAAGACAGRRPPTLADRFVQGTDGYVQMDLPPEVGAGAQPAGAPLPSLTPVKKASDSPTLEGSDPELAEALAAVKAPPTVEALQRVGSAYQRAGVYDRAMDYFTQAIAIDSRNSLSYDGRARVWRDWGQPDMALADAHRAVYFAPRSAEVQNTLGTVFFALGQFDEADAAFRAALSLDPSAAWAQNNLCYLALIQGDATAALARCAEALSTAPELTATRNNLALVYAAAGRLDEARATFMESGDPVGAEYNMGIVLMARRDYAAAAAVLGAVCREHPEFDAACSRAIQARQLAARAAAGK